MKLSCRMLFVVGLTVAGIAFFACNQLVDAKLPEQGNPPPPSSTSPTDQKSTSGYGLAADFWSDYEYNKNQEIREDSEYLSPILDFQENRAHAAHMLGILRDEVVPQVVNALVNAFPKTFGYLRGRNIGMGVGLNTAEDQALACFFTDVPHTVPSEPISTTYGLYIGYGGFAWNEDNTLMANSRKELESTVAHEMTHALMCESLTAGFMGYDNQLNKVPDEAFPLWFREGTAEAASGCARVIRLNLQKKYPDYPITEEDERQLDVTDAEMKKFMEDNSLTNGKYNGTYQIGWLAVMYLGYLAVGGTSMESVDIARGLDTILSQIHGGASLSQAIADNSRGKFSGLADFEAKFTAENDEAVSFAVALMNKIGSGRGSILVQSYADDDDLFPDAPLESSLFWSYVRRDRYTNNYDEKITAAQMFKGGFATKEGVPGPAAL